MPPSKHAVLSASSSHRWLNCNPSARLESEFEDRETEAAAEGTAAHALAEHKLRKALKMRSRKPVSKFDLDEMDIHTDGYVEFVLESLAEAKQHCADPKVLIEQRLDFSCYVPDGFGTGRPHRQTASSSIRRRTEMKSTPMYISPNTPIGMTLQCGLCQAVSPKRFAAASPSRQTL